jgi:colicin import membrane protein
MSWDWSARPGQSPATQQAGAKPAPAGKAALQAAYKEEAAAKKKAAQLAELLGDSHPTVVEAQAAHKSAIAAREGISRNMREALPKEVQQERAHEAALKHEAEKVRQEKHIADLQRRLAALTEQVAAATARRDAAAAQQKEAEADAARLKAEVAHDAIRKATEALQDRTPQSEAKAPCKELLAEVQAWAANEATPEQQAKLSDALRTLREHVEAARAEAKAKAEAEALAKEEAARKEEADAAEAAKRKAEEEEQAKKRQRG